jgi:hypothetical protein
VENRGEIVKSKLDDFPSSFTIFLASPPTIVSLEIPFSETETILNHLPHPLEVIRDLATREKNAPRFSEVHEPSR